MAPEMWGNIFYGEQTKESHIDALLLAEDSDLNDLKAESSTPVDEGDDEDGQDERAQNADEDGSEDTAVFFPEYNRLLRNTYAHCGDVVHQTFDQTAIGPRFLEIDDLKFSISEMNWKGIWPKTTSRSYALTRRLTPG